MTGQQILLIVSPIDRDGKDKDFGLAATESEPECVCRALGQVGKRRVPVEADPVWRVFTQTGTASLRDSLSPRTESPGQRQPAALSFATTTIESEAGEAAMSRTLGWPAQILRARDSMNAEDECLDQTTYEFTWFARRPVVHPPARGDRTPAGAAKNVHSGVCPVRSPRQPGHWFPNR